MKHLFPHHDKIEPSTFEQFNKNGPQLTFIINYFLLQYLNTVNSEFDGDFILAIVLGEIAHYNISLFVQNGKFKTDPDTIADHITKQKSLLPCNPFSISEATGIPRETVRRKFAQLKKQGLIVQTTSRSYVLTMKVQERFSGDFNIRMFEGLKRTFSEIQVILDESGKSWS